MPLNIPCSSVPLHWNRFKMVGIFEFPIDSFFFVIGVRKFDSVKSPLKLCRFSLPNLFDYNCHHYSTRQERSQWIVFTDTNFQSTPTSSGDLEIGQGIGYSTCDKTQGTIYSIRISNSIRNQQEIWSNYLKISERIQIYTYVFHYIHNMNTSTLHKHLLYFGVSIFNFRHFYSLIAAKSWLASCKW